MSFLKFLLAATLFSASAYAAFYPVNRGMVNQGTIYTVDGGSVALVATANQVHIIEGGTSGKNFTLPASTNLPLDWWYEVFNNSNGTVTYSNSAGSVVSAITTGRAARFQLTDRGTVPGTWKTYLQPSISDVLTPSVNVANLNISGNFTAGGNVTVTGSILGLNVTGTNSGDVVTGSPSGGLGITSQTLTLQTASTTAQGALSAADWTTFNAKQPAGNYITALTGNIVATGPGSVTATIQTDAVTTSNLQAWVVTNAKLAPLAVSSSNVQPLTITSSLLAANAVSSSNIQPLAVSASNIAAGAVTSAKLGVASVDLASTTKTGTLPVGNGGLGITSTPTNGQIPIGNGTTYTAATITAGTNITILNASGAITVSASSGSVGSWSTSRVFTYDNIGTVANESMWSRCVGDTLEVRGSVTAGSVVSAVFAIVLPASYAVDTTKTGAYTNVQRMGLMTSHSGATALAVFGTSRQKIVFFDGATTTKLFGGSVTENTGSGYYTKSLGDDNYSNRNLDFQFAYPTTGCAI